MIRKIEVIYRTRGVWTRGYVTSTLVPTRKDGEVIFSKVYPKETPIEDIWDELRLKMTEFFFEIFHPNVVILTKPPEPLTDDPILALTRQSQHIRERQSRLPEYYIWNPDLRKWHMSLEGYIRRTLEKGGPIDIRIGRSIEEFEDMYLLEELERLYAGRTLTLILFAYPDKYDDEIRALFELRVTFY